MATPPADNPLTTTRRLESPSDVALGRRIALYLGIAVTGCGLGLAVTRLDILLIAGGLVGLASTIVVLLRPYLGLLLYTVLFVLRPGELYPVLAALHLERLVGALTLASLVLNQLRQHREIAVDNSKQTKLHHFFTLAVALSVPLAYWRARAVDGLMEVLRIVGFYFMVAHLVDSKRRLRWFVWTFCALIAFLAFTSLRGYYHGGAFFSQGIERAVAKTSIGNNPNELGTTLASALPFFVLPALSRHFGWRRLLLGATALPLVVTIVLTGSRASMLGMLAGVACMGWWSRRRVLVGVLGLVALVAGFTLLPDQLKTRYSSMTSSELDASSRSRIVTWVAGLKMLADRPLFGVGIRCYGAANGMQYSSGRSWLEAHSLYLQVLGEIGLVGTLAFFSFLLEMLRLNRRTAQRLRDSQEDWAFERVVLDAMFAGLVVLLFSGIFGHSLLRRTWFVFAATALAIHRSSLLQSAPATQTAASPAGIRGLRAYESA